MILAPIGLRKPVDGFATPLVAMLRKLETKQK